MAAEFLAQVRLRSGTTVLTCWTGARVRAGDRITLRDDEPGRWWDVTWAGTERRTAGQLNRGWHKSDLPR
jgi:hypothetical protein